MHHLGQRCQAVGGAGGIGNDVLAGIAAVVDTHHKHGGVVFGGGGEHDFAGAGTDVLAGGCVGEKKTGGFKYRVSPDFIPAQVGRIPL